MTLFVENIKSCRVKKGLFKSFQQVSPLLIVRITASTWDYRKRCIKNKESKLQVVKNFFKSSLTLLLHDLQPSVFYGFEDTCNGDNRWALQRPLCWSSAGCTATVLSIMVPVITCHCKERVLWLDEPVVPSLASKLEYWVVVAVLPVLHVWLEIQGSDPVWGQALWLLRLGTEDSRHATGCCPVLLGDVAAAGHGDGAERRAKSHQECGRIIGEKNTAGQIEHSQVHGADGQILNCRVCHLRRAKRIRPSITQDVAVAQRLGSPVSIRPSAAWSTLCSRRRWLWWPCPTEQCNKRCRCIPALVHSCTDSGIKRIIVAIITWGGVS